MKHLKILGLGLIAGAALMAFVGVGTASATILEKEGGVKMVAGEEIKASVEGTAVLHAGFQNVECTQGSLNGKIENAGGAEATESAQGSFTYSDCNCTISVTNGTLEIHWIAGTFNAVYTVSGVTFTITCNSIFGKVTCRYITGNNKGMGTLTGSNSTGGTATADLKTTLTREEVSSGLCSENAELIATYKVTSPDVLNVTAS